MTDLTTFAAVLNSLKTAADIAKALKDSDLSIERAEMKLKVAELMGALADVKIAALELQETLHGKEKEISRLGEMLALKEEVVRRFSAYYKKGPSGKAIGDPYCLRCWESEKKLFHIVRDGKANGHRCPVCSTLYDFYETRQGLKGDEEV